MFTNRSLGDSSNMVVMCSKESPIFWAKRSQLSSRTEDLCNLAQGIVFLIPCENEGGGAKFGNPISSTSKIILSYSCLFDVRMKGPHKPWHKVGGQRTTCELVLCYHVGPSDLTHNPRARDSSASLDSTPATIYPRDSVMWESRFFWRFSVDFSAYLKPKSSPEPTYDANTLTTKRSCGQSASLQRGRPLTPHPMAGWVGHTLAERWDREDQMLFQFPSVFKMQTSLIPTS